MMVRRLQVNRHLRVIAETVEGMQFESPARLRPGQVIELVWPDGSHERARRARVITWSVMKLGSEGPTYGGRCRWQ
jgi:hypothetical protein